jgi:hypothetical protein
MFDATGDVGNSSATFFNMIEIDRGAPSKVASLALRAVEASSGVDLFGAARTQADEAVARSLGFTPAPPIYQIGTTVNATGVENFRASREDWSKLPSIPEACRSLSALVRDEARVDHVIQVPRLRAEPGTIVLPDGERFAVAAKVMDGIATHVTPGGAGYLRACPPELIAANLNHWFGAGYRLDARASRDQEANVYAPKVITLRTRRDRAVGREVFAVTGPRYAAFDVDRVAAEVADGVGGDARGMVTYDGFRATIDCLFHSNVEPERAVAGEFFKAGVRVSAADDGSGAIRISLLLWRNLCRNLIIIDFNKVLVGSRRHIGATSSIEADVREHVQVANAKIDRLVAKWSEASRENVLDRYHLTDVDDVFKGLVLNKVIQVPGVRPVDMVARLHEAWQKEPGYSKTAILNAITRAAHEGTWRAWSAAEDLESVAGELLFAKVWNCIPPRQQTADELLE